MKKSTWLLIAALTLLAGHARSQQTYYSIYSYNGFIPEVGINDRATSFQASILPEYYRTHSVSADLRWVQENDTALANFWTMKGDTVLHILRELSGFEWYETAFDIYLIRYHLTLGSGTPLVLPIGGIKRGPQFEVAPDGSRLILDLIYQLSHRMLDQTVRPGQGIHVAAADHPLMRPSPFRRDNLAMLLAISVCRSVIGLDSTNAAYRSAFWENHFPGRKIFEHYLLDQWVLTPDYTLLDWINQEPWSSELVLATRPPRQEEEIPTPRHFVEGLPLKGQLGFTVSIASSGLLKVEKIDPYRLAYACGLQDGDVIRRVNGRRARTQKDLVESILNLMDEEGSATLQVVRDDQVTEVVIRPMMLPFWDNEDEEFFPDSLSADSTLDSTTSSPDEY